MKVLFSNRRFVYLWAGQVLSLAGDWGRDMALLFWVFNTTAHSPMARAGLLMAQFGPSLIISPFAGVLVDRFRARNVLIYSDVTRGLIAGLQVWAIAAGSLQALMLLMVASSIAAQFFLPARSVFTREIVPQDQLYAANSLSNSLYNAMTIIGPALGSVAYFALGGPLVLALDGVTFLASALCVMVIAAPPARSRGRGPAKGLWMEFKDGLRYVAGRPALYGFFGATLALLLGTGLSAVTDIFLVTDVLRLPESRVAWLQTVQGASMLAASLGLGALAAKLPKPAVGYSLSLLITAAGLMAAGVAPNLFVLLGAGVILGVGDTAASISGGTLMQVEVEPQYLGRVAGAYQSMCRGAFLVSSLIAGGVLSLVGARLLLAVAGAVVALGALLHILAQRRAPGLNVSQ
ncbi:MAG TPA: MFS transporter [Symbiobacteriaceae bacterium]